MPKLHRIKTVPRDQALAMNKKELRALYRLERADCTDVYFIQLTTVFDFRAALKLELMSVDDSFLEKNFTGHFWAQCMCNSINRLACQLRHQASLTQKKEILL